MNPVPRTGSRLALLLAAGFATLTPPAAAAGPRLLEERTVVAPADGNLWAGGSLALDGGTLVLGAHEDADKEEKAAWVFVRDGAAGGWREEALLLPDGWPPPRACP